MRAFALAADDEAEAIAADLGGVDQLSAMERALISDFTRVGVVLRSHLARVLQVPTDTEVGRSLSGLAGVRLRILMKLGTKRRAREIASLSQYVEARKEASEDAEVSESPVIDEGPSESDLESLDRAGDDEEGYL